MNRYIKRSTKTLLKHHRITVVEDIITFPDGSEGMYLKFINSKDAVVILAINEIGQVLLNHEYNYPTDEYLLQLPAGEIETTETPENAATRELQEETGFIANRLECLGWIYSSHRRTKAKIYLMLATELTRTSTNKETAELLETAWIDVDDFERHIANNTIHHHASLAAWAMYRTRQ